MKIGIGIMYEVKVDGEPYPVYSHDDEYHGFKLGEERL